MAWIACVLLTKLKPSSKITTVLPAKPLFWTLTSILNLHHYAAPQRFLTHINTDNAKSGVDPSASLNPLVTHRDGVVYYDNEPIDRYRGHLYGLAIDIGTTTVVANLVDFENGETVSVSSFENPQRFGGSDIMHRISYDGEFEGELRKSLIAALNSQIIEMCEQHDFVRQEIYEIVVAGNTTMRDIFFRQDVQSIGQKPYKSLIEH